MTEPHIPDPSPPPSLPRPHSLANYALEFLIELNDFTGFTASELTAARCSGTFFPFCFSLLLIDNHNSWCDISNTTHFEEDNLSVSFFFPGSFELKRGFDRESNVRTHCEVWSK